jgi:hypothetical protein
MPKEIKNISSAVMNQIKHREIKMRPKLYFVVGSILTFVGLISTVITSVFLVSLTRFFFRSHGPMGQYRLEQLLYSFPWWVPILAIVALIVGIWILQHYDFSYKKSIPVMIIGFILAIITTGWLLDMTGLNDSLARRGPMKGMMRPYLENTNFQPDSNWRRF